MSNVYTLEKAYEDLGLLKNKYDSLLQEVKDLRVKNKHLKACMDKAGLRAFMRGRSPEEVGDHLDYVLASYAACEKFVWNMVKEDSCICWHLIASSDRHAASAYEDGHWRVLNRQGLPEEFGKEESLKQAMAVAEGSTIAYGQYGWKRVMNNG